MTEAIITPDSKVPTVAPEHAKALLERLIQAYPTVFFPFSERQVKPLKIGIYKDLIPVVTEWGYPTPVLKYVLRNYTRPLRYQLALLKAPHRVDLQGEPAGDISSEHRQIAQEKANLIKEKRKQQPPNPKANHGRPRRPSGEPEAERRVNTAKLAALQQKLSTKALP
ncbi:MAG: ProQ/FinO family protein [Candidatus Competibacteraceae bacterium]